MTRESRNPVTRDESLEPVFTGGPLQEMEKDERASAVRSALMRLSVDERAVVTLRHYQDMRFAEIARVLEIKEATAKSRMRYALGKLQRFLGGQVEKI